MSKPKSAMTSGAVIDALVKKQFTAPAHSVLREVRNGTGYSRQDRSADALVVSLWPSRGIWFAGVEVKVDRGDWLRELKDPAKSAEIQKWCGYWWVAAPEGVVKEGEMPETWGWLELASGQVVVRKHAQKLDAEALSPAFVAAILRRQADAADRARSGIRAELLAEMNIEATPTEETLRRDVENWKSAHAQLKSRLDTLEAKVSEFHAASGVSIDNGYERNIGAAFAIAQQIVGGGYSQNFDVLAKTLDKLSSQLREVRAQATVETLVVGEVSAPCR